MTALAPSGPKPLVSPLEEHQLDALNRALADLSPGQLAWVSGYLAGVGGLGLPGALKATSPQIDSNLTILYGSQTGNVRHLAESLGRLANERGFAARVISMHEYKPRDLVRERLLLILVSTQGEGEPPETARELHEFLHSRRALRLAELKYSVLGLGDSSYEHFCRAARDFDERLSELGATRLLDRECCDLDYEQPAGVWSRRTLDKAAELLPTKTAAVLTWPGPRAERPTRHDRKHPYPARLIEQRRLTTDEAVVDVRHLSLAINPQRLSYAPGDALGVRFRNDPKLVDQVLEATGLDAAERISLGNEEWTLGAALLERLELAQLHPKLVHAWSSISDDHRLKEVIVDQAKLRAFAAERHLIDLVTDFPTRPSAAELAAALQPMQPRLYSIGCSQAEFGDEVQLAVALVRFQAHGREHLGGASGFLSERLSLDEEVGVYVVENPGFRLPQDGETPIIMVGAGTGIAPYRAFLQQRAADGAKGGNWLVFGNRHFHRDFLYQLDWQAWRKAGLLSKTSLAFSRDGATRLYVQQRLREEAAAVYRWLVEGAHLYVCGATAMGQAVHAALLEVAVRGGGLSREAAPDFIESLGREGRYHRDLY